MMNWMEELWDETQEEYYRTTPFERRTLGGLSLLYSQNKSRRWAEITGKPICEPFNKGVLEAFRAYYGYYQQGGGI